MKKNSKMKQEDKELELNPNNLNRPEERTPVPSGYPAGYSGTTPDPLIVPSTFFDAPVVLEDDTHETKFEGESK